MIYGTAENRKLIVRDDCLNFNLFTDLLRYACVIKPERYGAIYSLFSHAFDNGIISM